MASIIKYFQLKKKYPHLFRYAGDDGVIKIITDPTLLLKEQIRLWFEMIKQRKPLNWVDIGLVSEDGWFWVVRDLVEFPGKDKMRWGFIRFINKKSHQGGFNVVLIPKQAEKYIVIEHFRHEDRGWSWEFPRGFGTVGLTAVANAQKELREELGVTVAEPKEFIRIPEGNGATIIYFSEIPVNEEIHIEIEEGIRQYKTLTESELGEWILEGKITDLFTVWAYALAKAKKIF